MAAKDSGGGGGAQLASGYISLNVKYASAMGQIADDFGAVEKKSKSAGESITKNLVSVTKQLEDNAKAAKAKVTEIGDAYADQKAKVAALRAEVEKLNSSESGGAQAKKAYREAYARDQERDNAAKQAGVDLQIALNKATEEGARNVGMLGKSGTFSYLEKDAKVIEDIRQKQAALHDERKTQMQELEVLAKRASDTKSSENVAEETAKRKALNDALAEGQKIFDKYGQAVEDAKRKQDLAAKSAEELKKKVGNTSGFSSWGTKLAQALGRPFTGILTNSGERAGRGFRKSFVGQIEHAGRESSQKVKRMANGIWMGMTPGVMGAAGVGLAIGKAFQAGFDREETINTVKLRLEALGQSATSIQQLISQAQGSVEGTQFSLAEAFGAASTAMQSNIKAGPDMVQYLNNIANAAGLTGIAYGDVAAAIGRVQRQGYVSLENIDPLIKKDLNVLGWLKDYYAKDFPTTTQADITDMISKKMIPPEVLNKVLTANLNDSMKGLTKKTVKGATADLFTQIGKVTQSILQPFMGDLPTFLNGLGVKLKNFAEYIKPGMAVAAEWIKRTWNDLWPKVKEVFGATVNWLKRKWEEWWPTISMVIERIKAKWEKLWPQLQEKIQPFLHAWGRAWTALGPYVKVFAGIVAWAVSWIVDRLPLIIQWVTNVYNWMATLLNWLSQEFFPFMKDSWDKFYKDIKGAWESAITFKDKVVGAFTAVKDGTLKVWDWLQDRMDWLQDKITWLHEHSEWITDPLKKLKEFFNLGGNSVAVENVSFSTPLVSGAGLNVPKPAGLTDSGHVPSGPQSRHVAGLLLSMFPGIKGTIGGSYLPRSEGGPSVPGTHDAGLSIDIPIGPSAEQRGMGDRIEKMLQENAKQLGIVYTIWKDKGKNTGMGDRAAGTEFRSGGHQNHIDVMFDGKTFGEAVRQSVGSNGATYTIADASASSRMGLTDMFRQAGINPAMFPLLQGFAKTEGNNPSGVPTLGFTDGQAGSSLAGHVAALAQQLKNRESVAGPFPVGAPWTQQAAWMAKVVGQAGLSNDWQGNAQPSLAEYIGRIVANIPASGRRQVSVDEFGGVANLSTEKPLLPLPTEDSGGPVPFPGHGSLADLLGDDTKSPVLTPEMLELMGPGITPGMLTAPSTLEAIIGNSASGQASGGGLVRHGTGASDVYLGNAAGHVGMTQTPTGPIGSLTNLPGLQHNFYKDWYPRKDGPKGTADDPQHTKDDTVAENTDPDNQPDAGAAAEDSTVTATDAPHAGSGAAPGPTAPGAGPGGKSAADAAEGLGGVAESMFSNQFEGTPFSNPLEWPMTKSVGALFSFFGNMLSGNTGSGASGLAGLLFPGSGSGATGYKDEAKIRESAQDRDRKATAADEAQKLVDEIAAKPFKFTDEEKTKAADNLVIAQQEANDALQDHNYTLQEMGQLPGGGAVGGLPGIIQNLMQGKPASGDTATPGASAMGPAALLPGGSTGFNLAPFGDMVTGTPGVAPGDPGLAPFTPGGAGASLPNPTGMISSASNAQPASQSGGSVTNIDASVNQQVPVEGQAAARDAALRGQTAALRGPLITTQQIPGVMHT